eukprot:scaffold4316_cov35-Tisochrysis_lutea.AAC.1
MEVRARFPASSQANPSTSHPVSSAASRCAVHPCAASSPGCSLPPLLRHLLRSLSRRPPRAYAQASRARRMAS